MRKLPSFYFGRALMTASRRPQDLLDSLHASIQAALEAPRKSMFVLYGCRRGNHYGLYARNLFNRDPFRRRLIELGLDFTEHPYLELTADGGFRDPGWGDFRPEFIILGGRPKENETIASFSDALSAFTVATYRLGKVTPSELSTLTKLAEDVLTIAADHDPELLVKRVDTD